MSAPLVWHLVRDNNAFIRKGLNGSVFSAEKGNLYSKHSYKYSGLANNKSIDISVDAADAVKVRLGSNKNATKPAKLGASTFVFKGNGRRAIAAVGKQAASFRPDLKKAAQAKMSAIQKSLRVKKATK